MAQAQTTASPPAATATMPTATMPATMAQPAGSMSTPTETPAPSCDVMIAKTQQSASAMTNRVKRNNAYAEIGLARSAQGRNDQADCQQHIQNAQTALKGT